MNDIKKITYNGYEIEIHPQPKTGDNTQSYLGVWKDGAKVFAIWEKMSGTVSRSMSDDIVFEQLERHGINRVKQMIDSGNFEPEKVPEFWESN